MNEIYYDLYLNSIHLRFRPHNQLYYALFHLL